MRAVNSLLYHKPWADPLKPRGDWSAVTGQVEPTVPVLEGWLSNVGKYT